VLSPPDDGGTVQEVEVAGEIEVEEDVVEGELEDEVVVVVPPWIRNPGLGNPFTLSVSIMNRRTYCWLTESALAGSDVFQRYVPALVKLMPADEISV
jgi:hypothetical protein